MTLLGASGFFLDETSLLARADSLAAGYQSATPFPHAVIDGFLPVETARALVDEFPDAENESWVRIRDYGKTDKLGITDLTKMGPVTRHVLNELNAGPAIRFVERLTGISGLVADPHLVGGGIHAAVPGGYLDVHADFNVHPLLHLQRRVNLLVYLNPGWQEEWGGQFELWTPDLAGCARRVAPLFNRAVVFDTTDRSFHGHPEPVRCPAGELRRAIALYYYSIDRPADERSDPHTTLYRDGRRALPSTAFAPKETTEPMRSPARASRRALRRARAVAGRAKRAAARLTADTPVEAPAPPKQAPRNHWELLVQLFDQLLAEGRVSRPNYTWSLLHVGNVARTLGFERFSAVEFGVAGGNGLLALEEAAAAVEELLGVQVEVHGFDTGAGLPPALDHRDAPYVMDEGEFAMDEAALRSRLRRSTLHLGLVSDTIQPFVASSPAPLGFVSIDVDYYSSTVDALRLFHADAGLFLPRVLAYFDDVIGYPWGDSNGERLAIREFNDTANERVIDRIPGLRYTLPSSQFNSQWTEQMYLVHVLDHPDYARNERTSFSTRLDLEP